MIDEDYFVINDEKKLLLDEVRKANDNFREMIKCFRDINKTLSESIHHTNSVLNEIMIKQDKLEELVMNHTDNIQTRMNEHYDGLELVVEEKSNNIQQDIHSNHDTILKQTSKNQDILERKIDFVGSLSAFNPFLKIFKR